MNAKRFPSRVVGLFLIAVVWLLPRLGVAHENAVGVVKERMELMKAMADQLKPIAAMVKGEVRFDAIEIGQRAGRIGVKAPEMLPLFPADVSDPMSEAKPQIWRDWPRFEQYSGKLAEQAQQLVRVAESGNPKPIKRQFARLAKACKSCHKEFRQKKSHPEGGK